jgi:hypothetical protein
VATIAKKNSRTKKCEHWWEVIDKKSGVETTKLTCYCPKCLAIVFVQRKVERVTE